MPSKPKRLTKESKEHIRTGRDVFAFYCGLRCLPAIERKQDYTVTDLVTDLLHFAASKGFDPDDIMQSAESHLEAETPVWCARCEKPMIKENAIPETNGPEYCGEIVYYCSTECVQSETGENQ